MPVDLSNFASVLLLQTIPPQPGVNPISQLEDGKILVMRKWLQSTYQPLHCWHNCRNHVANRGGRTVFGWALFYQHGMYQAQHHAIWCAPNGDYLDITPDQLPTVQKTVFLADGRVPYDYVNRRNPASFFYSHAEPEPAWGDPRTNRAGLSCFYVP